ncbi:MAG: hypothetical protein ACR2OR_08850 [Hyphomicrobiales bacterium]
MAAEDDLAKQIAELKREAEELSRARSKAQQAPKGKKEPEPPDEPAPPEPEEEPAEWEAQMEEYVRELESSVEGFAEAAEEGLKNHPVLAIAAAFALGIVIGRISK